MKQFTLLAFLLGLSPLLPAQSTALYDDRIVGAIYLELPADSLQQLIATQENEHYYRARFIFDDGQTRDTLDDAGLRLRGREPARDGGADEAADRPEHERRHAVSPRNP